ncbi:MAG: siderophore-interacting protein [Nocardioidaceae bacterium]
MSEPRRRRSAIVAEVVRAQRLSASMVRVVLGGPGLAQFQASPYADSYVKVVFVHPDMPRPLPLTTDGRVDVDGVRDAGPPEQAPRMRSYTVRAFDEVSHELTLDFVVHGDEGLAGPWADAAVAGDQLLLMGPGGAWSPDPAASYHLFAADASALPAVAVALERLLPDARGHAFVEVPGPQDEIALTAPAGVEVVWVHQGHEAPGRRLVEAVRTMPWPDEGDQDGAENGADHGGADRSGALQAFVHGEAGAVKELRRYLRLERGMGLERLSISGYWRLGVDDEGWRAGKREWNAGIEQAEATRAR